MTPKLLAQIDLGKITGVGRYQEAGARSLLDQFLSNIVGVLTITAGIAFLFYFILGALSWITAGGRTEAAETAKKKMTDAVIGLIAVVVAYSIISIVGIVLDIDILNPLKTLDTLPQ